MWLGGIVGYTGVGKKKEGNRYLDSSLYINTWVATLA